MALAEGHEADGEDEDEVQDSKDGAQNHCMPDMSCLPFEPASARGPWARQPEDTPCAGARLIPRG